MADVAGVEGFCFCLVFGAFDDGSSVAEDGDFVVGVGEFESE